MTSTTIYGVTEADDVSTIRVGQVDDDVPAIAATADTDTHDKPEEQKP